MKLALKIDVDTFRGTREGVPRLVEILQRHGAKATFLFSLGPDHTGRAIRRALRPGFLRKVSRTSVLEHYGLRTLLYGTVVPGPDIGRRCADTLRAVRDAGFEAGIHCFDHVRWQDGVEHAGTDWTAREMRRAMERFEQVMGEPAHVHGAAGWQMNRHAVRLTQRLGFSYCSDARGTRPFVPVIDAEIVGCAQLPTTLPTLDELIGRAGITTENVHERVLALTREAPPAGHVYTLHAELEGMKLARVFERLLEGWRAQGYAVLGLDGLFESLGSAALPRHELVRGEIPGRAGTLMMQGPEFLAGE
ncbi:MAG TPA: 4-deoxy-4-formamido-L-arabinose-phosphoundecaprenol deformylase [Rhodocyclaceae bacterium]|nr:MAG: 4-deoxy-4-formamido-L-arabinose-phosphoundecaprenol deformylase [Betaproteobacteria bacterium CG2_30_68_42]PIV72238.1 MAG: 4-deoxy-4-formamido-L-arabinose-phosphoundecaprenol deformylase [Rhodocyclales bacterium CG17_big_fil_post_rev_8_21_14_2_50_68_7]PIX75616.1 MAG: 4-deoxy-4-formamido-L-arabinose-phosphoundecaprenol deformylase [Rhodocyclales bacterium CG_4_10_14_3_um_filter_68_10]PJA57351.1 MAG: 4-deoxy-4-formamido-L-arabinose-phosphoundecaprenol deformylase [Rhodocyclales bacterium C